MLDCETSLARLGYLPSSIAATYFKVQDAFQSRRAFRTVA